MVIRKNRLWYVWSSGAAFFAETGAARELRHKSWRTAASRVHTGQVLKKQQSVGRNVEKRGLRCIQYRSRVWGGWKASLPDSPSICSGRSSCKWCHTVSPPLCTTLCSTCEGSWALLFYYPRQTRRSRCSFHPRTSAPRLRAPAASKITSQR